MPSRETPDPQKKALSNPTIAAARALGIPEQPVPEGEAIDLRSIDQAHWEEHIGDAVVIPTDAAAYLAGIEGEMTTLEKDHLEERIETFHGVKPPWGICFAAGRARLMRGI